MRTAIIIVGIFKFDKKTLDNVSKCYGLLSDDEVNTSDIFIYNNNDNNDNNLLLNYFGKQKVKCLKTLKNTNEEQKCEQWVKQRLNNKNVALNKNKYLQILKSKIDYSKNNDDINSKYSKHVPFRNNPDKFVKNLQMCSPHQWYQIYLCLNEIIKYENNNNFEYDYIMKIRLDFYLKINQFSPISYFTDKNHILLKSYNNLKKYYDMITEDDKYHDREFRINNYLYWRTTKYLGGQYNLNDESYNNIKKYLVLGDTNINEKHREEFNREINDRYVITINDACFFANNDNFKKLVTNVYNNYYSHFDENNLFWWTAESQFVLSIKNCDLFYFDYLQNYNFYKVREMWVNDYHGIEKYNKKEMKSD